jgi:hypothetical protein
LLVAYTTNANSSTTKSILENAREGPRQMIELSGRERAATLLTYNTAEMNRSLVESWEWLQIAIGLALVCTLPFALRLKWLYLLAAIIMFVIVIAQRSLVTPQIIGLGRMIDMAGGTVWTQDDLWKERRNLHTLQQLYLAGDLAKIFIGLGLTGALLIFRKKSALKTRTDRRNSDKIDAVNDSDYSHVDR